MRNLFVLVVFFLILALGGFRNVGFELSLRFALLFAFAVFAIAVYRKKFPRQQSSDSSEKDWTKTPTA